MFPNIQTFTHSNISTSQHSNNLNNFKHFNIPKVFPTISKNKITLLQTIPNKITQFQIKGRFGQHEHQILKKFPIFFFQKNTNSKQSKIPNSKLFQIPKFQIHSRTIWSKWKPPIQFKFKTIHTKLGMIWSTQFKFKPIQIQKLGWFGQYENP